MSEENVEALRRTYAAVNRGDIDALLATVHPDVEFTSLVAEAEGETFRGHDGVRRWWKEVVVLLGGLRGEFEFRIPSCWAGTPRLCREKEH